MTDTMPTSEVLNRAADLIEERGWAHGVEAMSAEANASLCLEGAISAVSDLGTYKRPNGQVALTYPMGATCPAYAAMASYLSIEDRRNRRVYDWNDAPGRTVSEVIEVLRACAVIEASRERGVAEVSPEPVTA